jgi:AcrR family transcriptional regulator
MTRPRGRPAQGAGLSCEIILTEALAMLDEGGGQGLTMRALAKRLDLTPMSLYRHVGTHEELLRALSDRVYAEVLAPVAGPDAPNASNSAGTSEASDACPAPHASAKLPMRDPQAAITALLTRYHAAIGKHPQLTLAIFSAPQAYEGVTREITDRLTALLAALTDQPVLWRDILIDHAHGSGLALVAARGEPALAEAMVAQYQQALACLLQRLTTSAP